MNDNITKYISQGMYILTTENGGCVVDSVSQISSGDSPLIAVSVMKKNNTNELMHKNNLFALSIIGKNTNPELIKIYGMNSMRDFDKFKNSDTEEINGLKILKDTLGYMILEKIDSIENETHTLFIGKLIKGNILKEDKPMTYQYYKENKNDLIKVKTEKGNTAWVCMLCGYVYYGEEIPDDFKCPLCGALKDSFKKQ